MVSPGPNRSVAIEILNLRVTQFESDEISVLLLVPPTGEIKSDERIKCQVEQSRW